MSRTAYVRHCPVCHSEIPDTLRSPFCSDRCRQIDLSRWLSEEYRIRGGEGEGGTIVHSEHPGDEIIEDEGEEE